MTSRDYNHFRFIKRMGISVGAIVLSLATGFLASCDNLNPGEEIQEGRTNVTSADIVQDTSAQVGKEVTIRNLVGEQVGNSAFTFREGGQDILVLNATGTPFTVPTGGVPVQATGTVEQFVVRDIESEYGLDLDPNLFVDYENQPVIIAQSLALAPNPQDLFNAPQSYFDQKIAVEGDVRKLETANNAFALFEEGWVDDIGVLVIGNNASMQNNDAIQEGENVTVTGFARRPDAALLSQSNLGWNDSQIQEFLSQYTNRPVIVADDVYPSAVDPAPES